MKIAVYRVTRETNFGNPGGNYMRNEGEQSVVEGAIGVVVGDMIRFSHNDIRNARGHTEYPAEAFLAESDVAFDKVAELEI
jgi:hypothetical protein